ncbi:acyl-CoA dehydrogenase, partial [Meiothermus sp. QL-1]|uniref:acyl-CoA dehydrogenase family protein n=1 Tax=Meiothermus sp. QL-1 TaxID=2058095 RepID=UPI000E2E251B
MTLSSALLQEVRAFLEARLLPLEPLFFQAGFRAVRPALDELRQEVKARGWWLPPLPRPWGMGLSLTEFARLSEELGRSPLGHYIFNTQAPDIGNMEILLKHGTPEQKERFLRPLAAGEIRSAFAMTEPEHPGSNPVWLSTRAVLEGDEWVIHGHKWYTTGFEGSGFVIVMCLTDPDHPNPYARASQIIVPSDAPGLVQVRKIPVMGEVGEEWASHAELRLEGVRVPRENLLGERGRGFAI